MNTTSLTYPSTLRGAPASARTALRLLERLRHGNLTVQLPDGSARHFGEAARRSAAQTHTHTHAHLGESAQPSAMITLHNW
ncbi:MAG: hypothetical protein ABIR55_09380, partial [Burkholderiaceae bacterium]